MMGGRGGRGGEAAQTANKADETPKMSIGVDVRTNSLIVAAPESLFEEVKQLVETSGYGLHPILTMMYKSSHCTNPAPNRWNRP